MAERRSTQRALHRYSRRSVLLGWVLLLASVVVILIGVAVGGVVGTVLIAFGGALTPAAVVNAFLDPLLREDAATDMRDLVGIQEEITKSGISGVAKTATFDLNTFVAVTSKISVIPLQYQEWKNGPFLQIIQIATRLPVEVKVYLTAPEIELSEEFARRHGFEGSTVAEELRKLPDQLLSSWDSSEVNSESTIEIFYYLGVPTTGVSVTDGQAAIEIGASITEEYVKQPGYVIGTGASGDLFAWAQRQVQFRGERFRASSAGMRPLPPPPRASEPISQRAALGIGSRDESADRTATETPGAQRVNGEPTDGTK